MNKIWLCFAAITLSVSGWLFAKGYDRFSEDAFNRGVGTDNRQNTNSLDRSLNNPIDRNEIHENHEEHTIDYGRNADNRSEFEKNENQELFKQNNSNFPRGISRNPQLSASEVRSQVRQNFPAFASWFSPSFNQAHGLPQNAAIDVWRASNWAGANSWIGAGWQDPLYYDSNGSTVDMGELSSAPDVSSDASQSSALAENGSPDSWLPLGVYALGTDTVNPSDTDLFVQLAVGKTGQLIGTYYNAKTDKAEALTGSVDKETQMASFYIANRIDSPIISTGIYNLTQNQSSVNVIMPDTSEKTWSMVKINP